MAKVGLPKKYAKMGFAKGWRAYKASKRKTTTKTKTRSVPVAAKKRVTKRRKVGAAVKKIVYRTKPAIKKVIYKTKPMFKRGTKEVVQSLTTAGSVLGANAISNYTPVLKDLSGNQKAAGQGAIGLGLILFTRNVWLKYVGGGMMLAGAFNVARQIPQLSTFLGADEGAVLSREEMAFLTSNAGNQMGVPERMGVQANYIENGRHRTVTNAMGVPEPMAGDWGGSGANWGY